MKRMALIFTLVSAVAAQAIYAQVTADDFLPPVQGGPSNIKQPDKVVVKGNTIEASTAQDAINAAVEKNAHSVSDAGTSEIGARMVKFPSGLGFVATGASVYRTMENPTATLIAKRKSYVIAFTQAKKSLAEILGGLTTEGKETIREALMNVNLPKDEMTNISTESEESLKQAVNMLLRGFVIYEVKDDNAQHAIYVSIVTTPKTRGAFARPTPGSIEADTLRDGLNQIITEVKAGLVPPVGGRIVIMKATGETAFVGFGSTVVRRDVNAAVQAKLNLAAQKIAAARAKDALCGLIIGDQSSWEGSVVDSMKDEVRAFEPLTSDDPLLKTDPAGVKKLEKARQTFVSKMESTDTYRSARQGVLPPGINTKTWFDADHTWAFAMSVYVPSLTNAAAQTAKEMQESNILDPQNPRGTTKDDSSSGFTDENNPNVQRPSATSKPGPTGKVGADGGL